MPPRWEFVPKFTFSEMCHSATGQSHYLLLKAGSGYGGERADRRDPEAFYSSETKHSTIQKGGKTEIIVIYLFSSPVPEWV